jgi:hypothetical protein
MAERAFRLRREFNMRTLCGTILAAAVAVFTVGTGAAQGGFDRPTGELQEKAQALADLD